MIQGRPKKYAKCVTMVVLLDDKDRAYLDDHKGKMTRGDYLVECMYRLKKEDSEYLKTKLESIKVLEDEVERLTQETKDLKKIIKGYEAIKSMIKSEITTDIDLTDKWWNDRSESIKAAYKRGEAPNWDKMLIIVKANYPGMPWNKPKDIQDFVERKIKEHEMI